MVKLIIWVIIGLLILSFFGVSLRTLVLSPTAQDNFAFVWQLVLQGWNWLVAWVTGLENSLGHLVPPNHNTSAAVIKARIPKMR